MEQTNGTKLAKADAAALMNTAQRLEGLADLLEGFDSEKRLSGATVNDLGGNLRDLSSKVLDVLMNAEPNED